MKLKTATHTLSINNLGTAGLETKLKLQFFLLFPTRAPRPVAAALCPIRGISVVQPMILRCPDLVSSTKIRWPSVIQTHQ